MLVTMNLTKQLFENRYKAQAPRLTYREILLKRFRNQILPNRDLDRRLVSFQANRGLPFYSWFKYKEGFSEPLVHYLLQEVWNERKPGVLLDPFVGAGSALFAARNLGWCTKGIEVLPVGFFAIQARLASEEVNVNQFIKAVEQLRLLKFAEIKFDSNPFDDVAITCGAFPNKTLKALLGYTQLICEQYKGPVLTLLRFAALCILESISYTRKDGQYLRWDARSSRSRGSNSFDKGCILGFETALFAKLDQFSHDLKNYAPTKSKCGQGIVDVQRGSSLEMLPSAADRSIDLVLTSPPYCNRYDYTRTYALELVYLGEDEGSIRRLRQHMLSCTVENHEKVNSLRELYATLSTSSNWRKINGVFQGQSALHEVLDHLDSLRLQDKLNNPNIVKMIRNYFYEMAFIVFEISRLLRRKGKAIFVNDNVRYAGEEVPVDLILCDFAEKFGLETKCIWSLPRGKGNSSQQMGDHGRTELRKCVYVWEKC